MFLGGATYDSYTAATTEEEIREQIEMELAVTDEELELRALQIERSGIVPPLDTDRVVIRIAVDPGSPIPPLGDQVSQRVETVTGESVIVELEFIFVQRTS